ncbi:MAG: hypothetical protein QOG41_1127, partial [Thermoleophilaceae bacterium]|nr:hypothetical protein [Thermoleophilaceae bacterium]
YAPGVTGGADGDYHYPDGAAYARNAADIVETRVAVDRRAWYLLVRLSTMNDPRRTALEARLGRHVLLVHGRRGAFDGKRVRVAADARQALFEVRVRRSLYDPGTKVRRLFVASGVWDPAARSWYEPSPGGSPFFDLAYVPAEGMKSYWRDTRQSGDIAAESFARDRVSVRFGALTAHRCRRERRCRPYSGPTVGLFSRVVRSGQRLGRGVGLQQRYAQDSGTYPPNLYRSPFQPYAIYVPRHRTGAMVLLLHFLGGNYMSYPISSMPQVGDWAEKLGAIVVMPLARGEGGWYEGEAERDVFEVGRDAARHYRVDRDRVYLAGMSMGGFGTWRLGQLYPDQFARGIVWSGPMTPNTVWAYPTPPPSPSCGAGQRADCGYNLMDLFGNTRDLPLFVVHGGADELVPSSGAEHWMADYAARGHATYRYLFYPDRRHETSYPGSTEPWVLKWLGGLPRRETNPVHVTYRIRREFLQPRFGIFYRRAYWTRGLRLAPHASEGLIDASRSGGADRTKTLGDSVGADGLGPYRLRGADVTAPAATPNFVKLHLSGLVHAVLDTRRMGWTAGTTGRVTGDTDTPLDLVLRRPSGSVTVHLERGHFDVVVARAGS